MLDRHLHAALAPLTVGVSPVALTQAFGDWAQHLLLSPDKQIELSEKALRALFCHAAYVVRAGFSDGNEMEPRGQDRRFAAEAWRTWPFNIFRHGFCLLEQWWQDATTRVPGVSRRHRDIVSFVAKQWLDMASPANLPAANPEVLKAARDTGGRSLLRGAANWIEDGWRFLQGAPPAGAERFRVGRDLASTPGTVIFRNHLIELIQYAPATRAVHPEPVLIVPAWLLKFYILDLSPETSLVRFLVGKGHTVFMISWKNPTAEEGNFSLEDYRRHGLMAALDAVNAVAPGKPVHGAGYCLGGTLLAIAAAAMARDHDDRLATLTFFATQTDFTETGQLMLFMDEAQIRFLEDLMAVRGYLDTRHMLGIFQLLRSNDLIWSAMIRSYLMAQRPPMSDLAAWNVDATRLPLRAHSEYLRRLVLGNDLAAGRYCVGDRPVSLRDIRIPIFAVSALADHIAPWRSVYGIQRQTAAEVTFALSSGGHNAGIVSPPGLARRHYQIAGSSDLAAYPDPDGWHAQAARQAGSWWPFWQSWLARHSAAPGTPPDMGAPHKGLRPLCDAPGTYVLTR